VAGQPVFPGLCEQPGVTSRTGLASKFGTQAVPARSCGSVMTAFGAAPGAAPTRKRQSIRTASFVCSGAWQATTFPALTEAALPTFWQQFKKLRSSGTEARSFVESFLRGSVEFM
jgi:hypothetical protein